MANIIRLGGGGGSQPTLITKNITQNGTYNASSDNADGYSSVNVSVSGGSTLALYSGKVNLTNGTISEDSSYVYSDFFDCPQGSTFFDFGETGSTVGFAWYTSEGNYVNYYSQSSTRNRTVNMGSFYQEGYKCRMTFRVANLSAAILRDFVANKIYVVQNGIVLTQ